MLAKFFSFKGRLNRKPYWMRNLALYGMLLAAYFVFALGAVGFSSVRDLFGTSGGVFSIMGIFGLIILPLAIAFYVSIFSLAARRLHDRNKSGWWLAGYFVTLGFIGGAEENFGQQSTVSLVVQVIGFLVLLWYIVEIGFLKGTVGANKYGPDPITGGSADPSVFE